MRLRKKIILITLIFILIILLGIILLLRQNFNQTYAEIDQEISTYPYISLGRQYTNINKIENGLIKVEVAGKYGALTREGKEQIPCTYDEIVIGSYIKVKRDDKWGVIDEYGNPIVACIYDSISILKEGFNCYKVEKEGNYGIIDFEGNEILPCIYSRIDDWSENLLQLASNGKIGVFDIDKKELILPCQYDNIGIGDSEIFIYIDGKHGVVNNVGQEIIPCVYDNIIFMGSGTYAIEKDAQWTIVNENMESIDTNIYEDIYSAYEPDAYSGRDDWILMQNEKYGVFGKLARIPCQYDEIIGDWTGNSNYFIVVQNEKYGVINEDNKEILPCQYERLYFTSVKGLYKTYQGNKWGLIKENGEMVFLEECDRLAEYDGGDNITFNEQFRVTKLGKDGIIDKNGNWIIPCEYNSIMWEFGYYLVEKNEKRGVIDEKGNIIVPCKYDFCYTGNSAGIFDGDFAIGEEQKTGIINESGQITIPCIYERIQGNYLSELGVYLVYNDSKVGIVDRNNNTLLPCIYNNLAVSYENDKIVARKNKKCGMISVDSKEIITFDYDKIIIDDVVIVQKGEKYGVFDITGKAILSCDYDKVYYNEGIITAENDSGCYIINYK